MSTLSRGPKNKSSKKSGSNQSSGKTKAKVQKSKLELTTEILENILSSEGCDYFTFFAKTSELLSAANMADEKDFAKDLRAYLLEYKSGEILKTAHMLQDIMLTRVENGEVNIFDDVLSHGYKQVRKFIQLFFCTADNKNIQSVFQLDLRYFKTVEMTGEIIRSKVLSVEKALYPFLICILSVCFIDNKNVDSHGVEEMLRVLESVTLAKEHSVDKLDNTVSAYSFLSLALCICLEAYKQDVLDISDKKFLLLKDYLSHQSRNLSFNRGRENVTAFEFFVMHSFDCIDFKNRCG